MPSTTAYRFLISGEVQGVGYRFFAQVVGRRLGLTGSVRNLPDGRVEVFAQGGVGALHAFAAELEEGAPFSAVTSVQRIDEVVPAEIGSFEIVR